MSDSHYLKDELYSLVSNNPAIFDFLQNGSLDGLWYWDIEKPENEWMNSRFWEIMGYDPKEKKHLSKEWQDIINQDDLKVALENFKKHCENPDHPYDQIVRYRHKNGKTIWVRCRGIAIRDAYGNPIRMLGAHNDLTELKEHEESLRIMASTDSLTGLANRRSFEQHFEWIIKFSKRKPETLSIAMIDIDDFKSVNDTYGHQVGDSVLVSVGSSINRACRETDFPARWGGEEFVVLLHGADTEKSLQVLERIRGNISTINLTERKITVSAGVSTLLESESKGSLSILDDLVKDADKALFLAKALGKDRVIQSRQLGNEE